jgi:DNA-binding NtrC family response regulator
MDDEADIRELVGLMLRPKGIDVIKAADWAEGMQALQEHADIEMVLLDLTLPGAVRTPVDAVQSVRQGTPVVVMSGYGAPPTEDMPGAYLPNAFLQKPFRPATLHETVERYAGTPPTLNDKP